MSVKEIIEKDKKYCLHGWGYLPIIVVQGTGAIFKDIEGKEYIDCLSQTAGVMGIGHTHPRFVDAVKKQLDKISHTITSFVTIPRAELAEKLAKIAPGGLKNNCKTYFACGGSEANECALKFAVMRSKKHEVISLYGAYHGATLATLSLSGQAWHKGDYPRFPGFHQIPSAYCYRCFFGKTYPDCDLECARALENHLKYGSGLNNVTAFILELVQGPGGHILPPTKEYFKIIRETCNKYDVLLIVDEVQTGMGRTGKIWACDYFNVDPDIMTSAKAIGGGLPVSATVIKSDIIPKDLIEPEEIQWHIFSFGGSVACLAGASAAIDVMLEERLPDKAARQGERMTKRLKEMQEEHRLIGEVRGPGLFIGVELVKDKKTKEPAIEEAQKVFLKSLEKGLFIGLNYKWGYGNTIKIKPPLCITNEQADKALDILDAVLKEIE